MNPVARAAGKEPNDRVREAIARVRVVARQSESYAYTFLAFTGTSDVLKVYVADGDAEPELTHCDKRGLPVGSPVADPAGPTRPVVAEKKRRWFRR